MAYEELTEAKPRLGHPHSSVGQLLQVERAGIRPSPPTPSASRGARRRQAEVSRVTGEMSL